MSETREAITRIAHYGPKMTWLDLHILLLREGCCLNQRGMPMKAWGRGMCHAIRGTHDALQRDGRFMDAMIVARGFTKLNGEYAWS